MADSDSSYDSDSGTDPRTDALLQAIEDGDLATLDRLVRQDPSVLQLKQYGNPVTYVAAKHGHLCVVDYLASHGVPLDQTGGLYGWTPLMVAAMMGHVEVVASLVTLGAFLTLDDAGGENDAAYGGHHSTAAVLLQHGIPVKSVNNDRNTPLHIASLYGNPAMVDLLVAQGADMKMQDSFADSPLHQAARWNRAKAAARLVALGSPVDLVGTFLTPSLTHFR